MYSCCTHPYKCEHGFLKLDNSLRVQYLRMYLLPMCCVFEFNSSRVYNFWKGRHTYYETICRVTIKWRDICLTEILKFVLARSCGAGYGHNFTTWLQITRQQPYRVSRVASLWSRRSCTLKMQASHWGVLCIDSKYWLWYNDNYIALAILPTYLLPLQQDRLHSIEVTSLHIRHKNI